MSIIKGRCGGWRTGRTACALVCGWMWSCGGVLFRWRGHPRQARPPWITAPANGKTGNAAGRRGGQGRPRRPLRRRGIFPIWGRPFPMQSGDLPALRRRPAPLFRSLRRRRVYSASGGFLPADGSPCSPSGSSGIWAKKSSTRRRMESSIRGTPIFSSISPKKRNLFFICSRVAG